MAHNPTLISATRDDNAQTNPIYVAVSDGTDLLAVNADGSINVQGSFASNTEYDEDTAHTSIATGNFVLTVRQDTLAASTSDDGDYAAFKSDAVGALYVNVSNSTLAVTQSGTWTIDSITNPVTITDGGVSITVDGTVAISGDVNVTNSGTFAVQVDNIAYSEDSAHTTGDDGAFVLAVRNDALADLTSADGDYSGIGVTSKGAVYTEILKGGAVNSETNPFYVYNVETVVSGTEVNDYDVASAVAKDASANHDYTASGGTFLLEQVGLYASVDGKIECLTGPVGTLVTQWVGFIGSKDGGHAEHKFARPIEVANTDIVRITKTNWGNAAFDLHSNIEGNQL